MLSTWLYNKQFPTLNKKYIMIASSFGVIALYFFHKGLDDRNDWYG
jgi:hypothetical protein